MKRITLTLTLLIAHCICWGQAPLPSVDDALKTFADKKEKVLTVTVSGELNELKMQKLKDALEYGNDLSAAVVILDSKGGSITAAQEMAAQIENFQKPTIVYIRKDALDEAVILCFAADEIIVNDDARVGGEKGIPSTKGKGSKVSAMAASMLKASAMRNGHNPEVAEAMVNPDKVLRDGDDLLSPKGRLLTLDAAAAIKKLANGKPMFATHRVGSLDKAFKAKGWEKAERVEAPFNGSSDFRTVKDLPDNLAEPIADKIEVGPDSKVMILELKSEFDQLLLYHFRRGFKLVDKDPSYVAVIIDMNTPGGRVDVLKEIAAFCNACRVPVILYVEDMAISAGAILSFATDEIYMKDGSHIGAAAPVLIGGGGVQEVPASYKEKLMSFIRSSARALAQKNGYREDVAEAMIDAEVEVKIGDVMISPSGKLLTLTAREAMKIMPDGKTLHGNGIVSSLDGVLKLKGLDKVAKSNVITLKTTASEKIARLITAISPLLFILGIICFYIEARSPGFGVFGATALASFGLIFFGHHIAQAAGFEGVLVFIIGVILLLLELFVIPGFGIAGISGILCMLAGFVWIMIPYLPGKTAEFDNPWGEFGMDDLNMALLRMSASIVLGVIAFWILAKLFPKTSLFTKLVHVGSASSDAGFDGTDEKKNQPLVGKVGVAKSVLRPSGIAVIDGKRVDVVTQGAFIEAGTKIRVKEVKGVRIVVLPIKDIEPPSGKDDDVA